MYFLPFTRLDKDDSLVEIQATQGNQNAVMATFTKIPDTETPVISINALNKVSKINDNVYGGFTEYALVYTKLFSMLLLIL